MNRGPPMRAFVCGQLSRPFKVLWMQSTNCGKFFGMNCPQHLTNETDFACYRPVGDVTLSVAAEMVDEAIRYCRENVIRGILIDITSLTGFEPPSTLDRFAIVTKWVEAAGGRVVVSMVAPAAIIDREKFGVTVGSNRGFSLEIFPCEIEARAWLTKQLGRSSES